MVQELRYIRYVCGTYASNWGLLGEYWIWTLAVCPWESFSCHLSQFQALLRCKSGPEVFLHLIAQLKCDIRDRHVVNFTVKVTGIWRHIINGAFWLICAWCLTSKPLDSSCTPLGNELGWDSRHWIKRPNWMLVGEWMLPQWPWLSAAILLKQLGLLMAVSEYVPHTVLADCFNSVWM